MTDEMDTVTRLRARKRGKPGELLLLGGALCLVVVPFVWSLNTETDKQLAMLTDKGVVAVGTITDKAIVEEAHTNRRGVSQTTTIHRIAVSYDMNAVLPYRDWLKTGQTLVASDPLVTRGWIDVVRFEYGDFAKGQDVPVVFINGDSDSLMLAEQLRFRTSTMAQGLWLAGYAAVLLAGIAMLVVGWKKRFSSN